MHKAWLKEHAPKEEAGSGSDEDDGSASASPPAADNDEGTDEDDEDGEVEDEADVESGGGNDGVQHADAADQDDELMGQSVAPVVKSSPVGSRSSSMSQVKRKMSKDGSKAVQPPPKKERMEDEGAAAGVHVSSALPKKKSSKKARRADSNGVDQPERKLKLPTRGLLSH